MPQRSDWDAVARAEFSGARDPKRLEAAVVTFHRRLDEVIDATTRAHPVAIACTRGCNYCCSLQVTVQPHEAFALAAWLRRNVSAQRLEEILARLRDNARRTRDMGIDARKRSNMACALLGADGACTAYVARPAPCRQFHSTRLDICRTSYENPADDALAAPVHPAVDHNAAVIAAQARDAVRDAGFDAEPVDMNVALVHALANPKAWRRWRDGKKPFVGSSP